MNDLNKLKRTFACLGLLLPALTVSRSASAEVALIEKDGWKFSFDGRVNAFLSVVQGDGFPKASPNTAVPTATHDVMGSSKTAGLPDVGWPGSEIADADGKYLAARVRSGMYGNILGFGLTRNVTETTSIKGYISIWSTIETLGRDKWAPVMPEAREGYFNVKGPWGSATVGRTFGWFGRMSTEIDYLYGHTYGVGLPCTDELGPSCGHIGTGVAFPGYSAGFSYSTPSLGGLQLHVGLYDPIIYAPAWKRASMLRPEGSLTFETKIGGSGLLKIGVEGLYQTLGRIKTVTTTDPATGAMKDTKTDESTSIWGASGGARLEVGPVRLGAAAFHGKGVGMGYALQKTSATMHGDTGELRTFTGIYGQGGLQLGAIQLAVGGGVASADQLSQDRITTKTSAIKQQIGVSAAVYYSLSDSVVLGADYFRFMAKWYGAPATTLDATGTEVFAGGRLLPAEKQDLNFINLGVTYHW